MRTRVSATYTRSRAEGTLGLFVPDDPAAARAAVEEWAGPGSWRLHPPGLDLPVPGQAIVMDRLDADGYYSGYSVFWAVIPCPTT